MTEHKIPAALTADDAIWAVDRALCAAQPGDTVVVRTWLMQRLAEATAERIGKTGITVTIAETLDD